ncbi:hypothetical protein Tco_0994938 [Tanacetum coccineum]
MEGDFLRIHLHDIEDMLLLIVQNRLFNLKGEDIVHLATALRMFTRRIVIQKRVEDLQLGVERYQKKLNIPNPRTYKLNRKRLMRSDELYKFSDGTLQLVQDTLHDMATNLRNEERRLMRSLEKFVGGRHYGEDLRLLQRTI